MIQTYIENGVQLIKMNNAETNNSLEQNDILELQNLLRQAAVDTEVKLVVLTGEGDYFCSGSNLSLSVSSDDGYIGNAQSHLDTTKNLVDTFIEFPKLLIALVNGPCIGIATAITALCDIIYCASTAYFSTPDKKLGLCVQGCASYTLPRILGASMANEMLHLNRSLTALEAKEYKFVSRVYDAAELSDIWMDFDKYTKLSLESITVTKELIRGTDKDTLLAVNAKEMAAVCRGSKEAIKAIVDTVEE